ncbi:probable 4-coumarate--CoA ligase 1 [Aedes albopictus]|uniref:Acyl-coa synthetase n=1 Tax=Aedes albopictus TaxID=7160 RepID=A0ABM1XNB5_AEDAL|nr:probable 4-coumarate--CoA ligase 1 [Aedes albopictus]
MMHSTRNVFTFYDPAAKVWSGLPRRPIFNPDQSLGDLILQILERNAGKVMQISADSGVELTGGELRLRTIRIAQNLARMGFGDHSQELFTMIARNGEHTAPVLFACFALGIPVNTLDPSFQRDDLSHMFQMVQPKVIFCETESLDETIAACEMSAISPLIILMGSTADGFDQVDRLMVATGQEEYFVPTAIADPAKHLAILICSSGTTGRPKAVCLSHSICIAHVANFFECHPSDRAFAFSSLYWLSGLIILLCGTILGATRIITRQTYRPELALDIIKNFKVSALCITPSQAYGIIHSGLSKPSHFSSIRYVFCGGSAVPTSLKRSFEKLIPGRSMEVAYGFSEIAYSVSLSKRDLYRDGSVGFPRAGTEFKIIDDDGNPLENGQEGEIVVRAEFTFLGYYGNDQARGDMLDGDGWLHSGDIGRFDDDGYLYVVDRKKEMFKYNNFPISPTEIESVIQRIEGVAAVCVVGIPGEPNDLATALVVRKSDCAEVVDATETVRKVNQQLPDYKHLRGGVYFAKELPLTPSGKVLRRKVRDFILSMKSNKSE